ncbi:hypothetical protein HK104_002024, partial [Borealophlyctis nickersoniae]
DALSSDEEASAVDRVTGRSWSEAEEERCLKYLVDNLTLYRASKSKAYKAIAALPEINRNVGSVKGKVERLKMEYEEWVKNNNEKTGGAVGFRELRFKDLLHAVWGDQGNTVKPTLRKDSSVVSEARSDSESGNETQRLRKTRKMTRAAAGVLGDIGDVIRGVDAICDGMDAICDGGGDARQRIKMELELHRQTLAFQQEQAELDRKERKEQMEKELEDRQRKRQFKLEQRRLRMEESQRKREFELRKLELELKLKEIQMTGGP